MSKQQEHVAAFRQSKVLLKQIDSQIKDDFPLITELFRNDQAFSDAVMDLVKSIGEEHFTLLGTVMLELRKLLLSKDVIKPMHLFYQSKTNKKKATDKIRALYK